MIESCVTPEPSSNSFGGAVKGRRVLRRVHERQLSQRLSSRKCGNAEMTRYEQQDNFTTGSAKESPSIDDTGI